MSSKYRVPIYHLLPTYTALSTFNTLIQSSTYVTPMNLHWHKIKEEIFLRHEVFYLIFFYSTHLSFLKNQIYWNIMFIQLYAHMLSMSHLVFYSIFYTNISSATRLHTWSVTDCCIVKWINGERPHLAWQCLDISYSSTELTLGSWEQGTMERKENGFLLRLNFGLESLSFFPLPAFISIYAFRMSAYTSRSKLTTSVQFLL